MPDNGRGRKGIEGDSRQDTAPYQIRAEELASEKVKTAVGRKCRPCRILDTNTLPKFTDT